MEHIRPKYYDKFACIASLCEESCCKAGWEITIDDKTFDVYSSLEGEIGEKFKSSITEGEDGDTIFKLDENGDCPFLNKDGLCELYIATDGKLCEICDKYPRFFEEFDGFSEAGISISCPEAQRIILNANREDYVFRPEQSDDEKCRSGTADKHLPLAKPECKDDAKHRHDSGNADGNGGVDPGDTNIEGQRAQRDRADQ